MKKQKENKDRERRITYEIVVDCYNEEESSTGWHCYLEESLKVPFQAECIKRKPGSPLRKGEIIKIIAMSDLDLCSHEMIVDIELLGRKFAVPLDQLRPIKANKKTIEAVEDRHYWKKMGYEF
ncbi:MAG: calcium-binding protein [Chitinivibrionales bacterium]|nr:calcium-binding protein [Chitinivibrionales bacterium]